MSNRKSLPHLQAEFMLRQMQFASSPRALYKRHAIGVNCNGGIAKDDPTLQMLVEAGEMRIVRQRRLYRNSNHRITLALLTKPIPDVIDTTCPGCGKHWVKASPQGDGLVASWDQIHDADCQLKDFRMFAS